MKSLGRRSWSRSGESGEDVLGHGRDGPLDPAHRVVRLVGQDRPPPLFPQLLQQEGEQRQASRFLAHVAEDSLGQARLEFEPHLGRGGLDDLPEFPLVHRAERDLGVLADAVDQGAIVRGHARRNRPGT